MSRSPKAADSKEVVSHFAFGENWASFAGTVDECAIRHAEHGMLKLLTPDELAGRSFLDIGCGSGLHTLAAARLGAARILATDIDPVCVDTTRKLLARHGPRLAVETRTTSVFDLSPDRHGCYDIVYSWGALHHTGDLHGATRKAAAMVAPGGLFVFALYRRTSSFFDRFWTCEKRWYAQASGAAQKRVQSAYVAALRLAFALLRRDFRAHVASYKQRGADFVHDVHDWLGGYPYEVISPAEVRALMQTLGFEAVREFIGKRPVGVFGSGCDEYVYQRLP